VVHEGVQQVWQLVVHEGVQQLGVFTTSSSSRCCWVPIGHQKDGVFMTHVLNVPSRASLCLCVFPIMAIMRHIGDVSRLIKTLLLIRDPSPFLGRPFCGLV
jgi:hypothetical protein